MSREQSDKDAIQHITIHTGRTPGEIVAKLREKYPPVAPGLRERISTLEALADQLAEAVDLAFEKLDDYVTDETDRDALRAARAAYEADKEARNV